MKTQELEAFHNFLEDNVPGYISMIIDGSVAVGDVWVPGESDYDILLIFEDDYRKHTTEIGNYLKKSSFTDEYLFVPFLKTDYAKTQNNTHDFSRRFRTKVLFGVDITGEGDLPSGEKSHEIYETGLRTICRRLETRLMNAGFWSEMKTKKVFHPLFKHCFMYLAIGEYLKTGKYPKTRKLTSESIGNEAVTNTLRALENRNSLSKEEIIEAATNLVDYLKGLSSK